MQVPISRFRGLSLMCAVCRDALLSENIFFSYPTIENSVNQIYFVFYLQLKRVCIIA